jgi:hypothetical protein
VKKLEILGRSEASPGGNFRKFQEKFGKKDLTI